MQRGITLPLTQVEFGILCVMVVLCGLVGWWLRAKQLDSRAKGRDRGTSEHLLEIFSWLLSPIWAALILFTLYLMWRVGNRLIVLGPGEDLRWYALGFVGLVTAFGAVLSAPLALIRVATTERQTRTAEQGHMTDRISKAVEQLGAEKTVKKIVTDEDGKPTTQESSEPNLEVRIGGLLSLERIAQDSTAYDKGRDHVRVMEIICAYIRNNAPASQAKDFPLGGLEPLPEDATPEQRETYLAYVKLRGHEGHNLRDWAQALNGPREDIVMALSVLERRSDKQRRIEAAHGQDGKSEADWVFAEATPELPDPPKGQPHLKGTIEDFKSRLDAWTAKLRNYRGYRPDLRDTCLQAAALSGFRLSGVRLDGARLEGADLREARMEAMSVSGARLAGANLSKARLEGAVFSKAHLDGASADESWMVGAELKEASLLGVNLKDSRMTCAFLGWAQLNGAILSDARLEGADFRVAQLIGSVLQGVRAEGAILVSARLMYANLTGARLQNSLLLTCRLEGATLRGAKLEGANLGAVANLSEATMSRVRLNSESKLIGANFRRTALHSVDLSEVVISQRQVDWSFGDLSVVLADDLQRPAHWPDWELDFGHFYNQWRRWRENPDAYTPPPKPAD